MYIFKTVALPGKFLKRGVILLYIYFFLSKNDAKSLKVNTILFISVLLSVSTVKILCLIIFLQLEKKNSKYSLSRGETHFVFYWVHTLKFGYIELLQNQSG